MSETQSAPSQTGNHSAPWLWPAAIACLGLAHLINFPTLWDDAFISFRLAERWAATGVLAFNPGAPQPVATNFLWVVLLAAAHKLTGLPAPIWAQALGVAAGLLTPLALWFGLRRLGKPTAAVPAAALCVGAGVWAAWPLAGLETSLFTLLVTVGALAWLQRVRGGRPGWMAVSALAFALAALTRPDGLWVAAASGAALLARRRPAWRDAAIFGAVLAAVAGLGALAAWHWSGGLLPNAFYAKLHGGSNLRRGWEYLRGFLGTYRIWFLLPFVLPAWSQKSERALGWYPALILAVWLGWVAVIGGDFMPYHRFLAPVWPLFCLLLGLGLAELGRMLKAQSPNHQHDDSGVWGRKPPTRIGREAGALSDSARGTYGSLGGSPASAAILPVAGAVLVMLLALQVLLPTYRGPDHVRVRVWSGEERDRRLLGEWLGANFTTSDLLALKPAGIIPYYSGLPAVDFYGLLDRRSARGGDWIQDNWVGHQRVAVAQVLDLRPRIVILDEHLYAPAALPVPEAGEGAVERAWRADERRAEYVPMRAEIAPGRWVQYFQRRP